MNEKIREFVKGMLLGLPGKPHPMANKEPVAYLYNGVQMPAFPDEYAVERPYAVLLPGGFPVYGTYYGFVFSKTPITVYQKDGAPVWNVPSDSIVVYTMDESESEYSADDVVASIYNQASRLIWSNHDILNEDGTVYLAASEPIPVYE